MSANKVTTARSHLAHEVKRAKRHPEPGSAKRIAAARRDLAAAKLESYVSSVVAAAPPLTRDQKNAIALLITGGRS